MSEIEQYQTAKSAHDMAVKRCENIARVVHQGAVILSNWKRVMVSNSGLGFPPEVALNRNSPSFDVNQWATATEIAEALSEYHKTKADVRRAYDAIPASQREVIVPPAP